MMCQLQSEDLRRHRPHQRKKQRKQRKSERETNNMALNVRRVVTGHDASGKSEVKTDELVAAASRNIAGITGCEMWPTDQMPVDNSAAAAAAQRAGFAKHGT